MQINTANGLGLADAYGTVWFTIQERDRPPDSMEVPDSERVSIGQIPIDRFDFVVDPRERKLSCKPANDGEYIIDAL